MNGIVTLKLQCKKFGTTPLRMVPFCRTTLC